MARFRPLEIDRDGAVHALDHARTLGVDLDLPGVRDVVADLGAGAAAVLPSLWRVPDLAVTLGREVVARGEPLPALIPPPHDSRQCSRRRATGRAPPRWVVRSGERGGSCAVHRGHRERSRGGDGAVPGAAARGALDDASGVRMTVVAMDVARFGVAF